ncbi:MAG: thioredoxin domain-containing protein [Frankiales bacterium]|nr:thioredoxin domain-containing protein [Frankiales bacterium]
MSPAPKESKRTTKEKAAAARAAAEAEQRRRDRRVRILGGIAVVVAVGLIFGAVYWNNSQQSSAGTTSGTVADAAVPTGVLTGTGSTPWGVPYNTAAGKPTLAIWEDFQCPSCGQFEQTHGADVVKMADEGKVNLVWRPTAFLDARFAATSPNPNSSLAAAMAWGCAIDAGKAQQYHSVVFHNQPANEGDGYSQAQLLDFGKQAGITGDAYTTFETCVQSGIYRDWVNNSYQAFQDDGVPGTPTAYLNGTEVPSATLNDMTALAKLIADNS